MMKMSVEVERRSDRMTSDMCKEINISNLIHKITNKDTIVAFVEPPNMLLFNNAKIVNNFFPVNSGKISVGVVADIILVDYIPPTPFNEDTFYGHYIFGIAGAPVDTTIVGGNILIKHKKLERIDEKKVCEKSR